MSEVIVITSGKGGVGKTTTTANVGTGLAKEGKKVVMIPRRIFSTITLAVIMWSLRSGMHMRQEQNYRRQTVRQTLNCSTMIITRLQPTAQIREMPLFNW